MGWSGYPTSDPDILGRVVEGLAGEPTEPTSYLESDALEQALDLPAGEVVVRHLEANYLSPLAINGTIGHVEVLSYPIDSRLFEDADRFSFPHELRDRFVVIRWQDFTGFQSLVHLIDRIDVTPYFSVSSQMSDRGLEALASSLEASKCIERVVGDEYAVEEMHLAAFVSNANVANISLEEVAAKRAIAAVSSLGQKRRVLVDSRDGAPSFEQRDCYPAPAAAEFENLANVLAGAPVKFYVARISPVEGPVEIGKRSRFHPKGDSRSSD